MSWLLALFAWIVLVAQAQAQPGGPRFPERDGKPRANVVTRVNVNVETDIQVGGQDDDEDKEDDDEGDDEDEDEDDEDEDEEEEEEDDDEDGERASLKELAAAVFGHPSSMSSINVVTDLNINVQTRVRVQPRQAAAPAPKKLDRELLKPEAEAAKKSAKAEQETPKAEQETPKAEKPSEPPQRPRKKGRMKKRPNKSEQTAISAPAETTAAYSLRELQVGERVRLGVAGQFSSDQEASQRADQINGKARKAMLGLAILGTLLPEEQESLGVLREAVGSVKAEAKGSELSVSVVIPWKTIGAVRELVAAARERL